MMSCLSLGRLSVAFALLGAALVHGFAENEPGAVITEVDSYQGLLDVAGTVDDTDSGARFQREVIMLLTDSGRCEPDFERYSLDEFAAEMPSEYALVSADVSRVDQKFLDMFELGPDLIECPTAIVITKRSRMDAPKYTLIEGDPENPGELQYSVLRTQQVAVGVVNDYNFPIRVYYSWRGSPEAVHIELLMPGKESWMLSYKTTELTARTRDGRELQRFKVPGHSLFTVADRHCNAEDCGIVERPESVEFDMEELEIMKRNEAGRLANNQHQPKGLPKFTETGFKKIRVPDDEWDDLVTYYRQNKDKPKKEQWGTGNVYTNNVEAPSYMVNLPEIGELKPSLFNGLKPLLEEWSGVDLTPTSCYGIRVYTNGSWLSNHVDTRATHAISAIINVDQEVAKDWPLMIYDHAGNSHNITMAPRDMVLYESAVCVHGRPTVFDGKFYANMFIHYKPTDPERWI